MIEQNSYGKSNSIIVDFGMKKEIWGEALYTATYLFNGTPCDSLKVTPFDEM